MADVSRSDSETSLKAARHIAALFDLPGVLEVADFAGKGNINQQTYLVCAGPSGRRAEYLLQRLNPAVFTQPRSVMAAMIACLEAQQKALAEGRLREGEEWETIRLIPTRQGQAFLEIEDGTEVRCWRMMARIHPAQAYKSLREIADTGRRLRVALEAGKGLALFGALTSGMDPARLRSPLPGYRDTDLYYAQLHSILEGCRTEGDAAPFLPTDAGLRMSTGRHFLVQLGSGEYRRRRSDPQMRPLIALALEQKPFARTLARGLESGAIKKVIVHGDTKLDNFLFNPVTGNVRALVDLDTIMPHTWLSDWGDMTRSLVNIAGERETDPEKVEASLEIFGAMARGFLRSARPIAPREIGLMADAPQIMALELGVRFLTDYLRGDSYFQPGPADPSDLNKTRAMVQFRLFERLLEKADRLRRVIEESRP